MADTVFEQVSKMFGIGVAEQLNDAGLLVRDHVDSIYSRVGVTMGGKLTHWMVRATYDGMTDLSSNRWTVPNSLDAEFKDWIHQLRIPGSRIKTKVWGLTALTQATRVKSMINNWGTSFGISAKLIPIHALELS